MNRTLLTSAMASVNGLLRVTSVHGFPVVGDVAEETAATKYSFGW